MAKKDKIAAVFTGIILFLLAAIASLGLIMSVLDFGNVSDANLVYKIGKMLGGSFGISSILIPAFLYFAGALCFSSRWTFERAVALMISVIPFYTMVFAERVSRAIYASDPSAVASVKIGLLILIAILVVAAEYLVSFLIAGKIRRKGSADRIEVEDPEKVYVDSDETMVMEESDEPNFADEDKTIVQSEIKVAPEYDIWSIDDEGNIKGSEVEVAEENEPTPGSILAESITVAADDDWNNEDNRNEDDFEIINEKPAEPVSESEKLFGMPFDEDEEDEDADDGDVDFFATLNPTGARNTESAVSTDKKDDELLDDLIREFEEANMQEQAEEKFAVPEMAAQQVNASQSVEAATEPVAVTSTVTESKPAFEARTSAVAMGSSFAQKASEPKPVAPSSQNRTIVFEEEKKPGKSLLPGLDNVFAKMDFDAKKDAVNYVLDEEIENEITTEDENENEVSQDFMNDDFDMNENIGNEIDVSEMDSIDLDSMEMDPIVETTDGGENVFNPIAEAVVDANGKVKSVESEKAKAEKSTEKSAEKKIGKTAVVTDLDGKTKPITITPKKRNRGAYKIPTDLLTFYEEDPYWIIDDETKQAAEYLKQTLQEFKIEAEVTGIQKGPVVTMFEILPAPGVKLNRIVALQDNIALRLAASSVRIVAPIPGKRAVGIEVPNEHRSIVSFRECIERNVPEWKKMAVPVVLGKDIEGQTKIMDLVKTPHLLIAGSTGAGKSVCVNSMILSILFKRNPNEVKMILIDPKIVELKLYNDIPHLLTPVITEPKKAMQALQYCLCEMERRYALLDSMGCRDISSYNHKIVEKKIATEHLPYLIVIIDEFADLMATTGKQLESVLARLAAMSRAVGIHLVLATQRPSIDVITGLIKANIPSRIAFMVASKMDSRIIIDQVGAEKLLGKGDMLYASATDPYPVRIQGTFISDQEVEDVVTKVKEWGEPEYIDDEIFVDDEDEESGEQMSLFNDGADDPLYDKALEIVLQAGKASASYIQRRLSVGYNRAARLVELMEERGIVGPANGSKPREIIHVP